MCFMNTTTHNFEDFNDLNTWKRLAILELATTEKGKIALETVSKVLNLKLDETEALIKSVSNS